MVLTFEVETIEINPPQCIDIDYKTLAGIKFGSLNPNSLNISDYGTPKANNFYNKLNSFLKLNRDIWCLQDTRLAKQLDAFKREIRVTRFGRYSVIENSKKGSGGVATIIRDTVPYKIYNIHRSDCENALLIDMSIKGFRFLLCNIYGPRHTVADSDFFIDLNNYINSLNIKFVLINGDLNAVTTASQPTADNLGNIECYDMATVPNLKHSKTLSKFIADGIFVDQYRITHPNTRIYSHIPYDEGGGRPYRSRIDNILCSPELSRYIKKTDYANLTTSKCDHKPILFLLGAKKSPVQPKVDQTLLSIPNLFDTAKFSIIEAFVNHSNIQDKQFLQEWIARIGQISKHIQALTAFINSHNDLNCPEIIEARAELTVFENSLNEFCNAFPDFEIIENLELSVDFSDMLEVVLNALKNSVISHQTNYIKLQNKRKFDLSKELETLRKNNQFMSDRFKIVEKSLIDIENSENLRLIKKTKHFDVLNAEKITGPYAELLRNSNDGVSMSSICRQNINDENIEFENDKQRSDYISSYYQGLFGHAGNSIGSIEDFLGPYVNHPTVLQHKLSEEEKASLEQFFTMEELEKALRNSNFKSASGLDGIGFETLRTFWPLIKNTILKAFNSMIEKKELKGLMVYSKVRLLRKGKKDPKRIKNWRPIALLSCTYKLFSGICDLRLRKYIDKLCHRSQKAYSDVRSIHESLLNVLETLGKAKNSKTPLSSVLVDFSRAFDSVSHEYIRKVLLFHNFGPFFTEIIMTTLKNRKASIINEDGTLTPFFDILIGVLQGDRDSPQIFKLCINPLLIRITLDENVSIPNELPYIAHINENPPDPLVGFADDLNVLCKPTIRCFRAIKMIFDNFGNLSNLKVNETKTKIVFHNFHPPQELLNVINELGYSISTRIEILGFEFEADLSDLNSIWDKILVKVKKMRNFWAMMHLSVPGRVNVIRTYFYSQVSYVGTILTPPPEFLSEFENIIVNFIKQKTKIAKSRIFATPNAGGLGLPVPKLFILSLKIKLFLMGQNSNDTWGGEMRSFFDDHKVLSTLNIDKINLRHNPFLGQLAHAFLNFASAYITANGNIRDQHIFDNLIYKSMNCHKLTLSDLTLPTRVLNRDALKALTFKDMVGLRLYDVDYQRFKDEKNIELTNDEYKFLVEKTRPVITKLKTRFNFPTVPLNRYCNRKTIKSKDFRKFMDIQKDFSSCAPSRSRALWASSTLSQERENAFFNVWNLSFLPISLRDFSFKFFNSQLYLNGQVSHLPNSVNTGNCTFCAMNNIVNRETYEHFFINCPTVKNIMNDYFHVFLNRKGFTWDQKMCLIGTEVTHGKLSNMINNIEIISVLFYIVTCKNKKIFPNIVLLEQHMHNFREIFRLSNRYNTLWQKWQNLVLN